MPKFNTFRVRFRRVLTRYEALRVMRFSILYFHWDDTPKASGHLGRGILPACLPAPVWAAIRNYTAGLLLIAVGIPLGVVPPAQTRTGAD